MAKRMPAAFNFPSIALNDGLGMASRTIFAGIPFFLITASVNQTSNIIKELRTIRLHSGFELREFLKKPGTGHEGETQAVVEIP